MTLRLHRRRPRRKRDKVPQPCQPSPARAVVHKHRVLPNESIESRELGDMGAFDMDVEGVSPEVSVPKKSRIASLTIAGKWVNVLMQTAMMAMLVNATLPSEDIYGHPSGKLLHPLACARRSRERT